jgi:hypothetical protein
MSKKKFSRKSGNTLVQVSKASRDRLKNLINCTDAVKETTMTFHASRALDEYCSRIEAQRMA